ncbi:hepatocyte growth factor-regulated tyrosine kinase substrate isoform X2 [Chrysoperla carnea]|nr:hepatocyte growth factor-regulated tyrosine kinase substrate isoform X2 [Chrysoperla carnea]
MKAEGYKFPVLNESDAMFSADSAPEWSDGTCCHRCRVAFSMMQRKHHCRACGQVFCGQCSQHTATLPKFGIEKEVRVCDGCYDQLSKPSTATPLSKAAEGDVLSEYVTTTATPQTQTLPGGKTEEELREEEELNLALALSQSEAEHKEKEKKRITRDAGRSYSPASAGNRSPSPKPVVDDVDPELARYLNRSYWEQKHGSNTPDVASPSAPSAGKTNATSSSSPPLSPMIGSGRQPQTTDDPEMDDFVAALKSQVEIFVNRMKSNSSRGRSIANDSSVQTLFMNITAMHSRLLRYIQQQDDERLRFEGLQDKLSQVKDARAALDALREEHAEQLRREAEEAERQRQLQMAHKLEIMRKKKQEYLQYQRQLALQRIQEQEREMQMRQEQQKQQYLMGNQYGYMGSPVHMPGNMPPPPAQYGGPGMPGVSYGPPPGVGYPMYSNTMPPPPSQGGPMPPPGHMPPQMMGNHPQAMQMGPPPPQNMIMPPPQQMPMQMQGPMQGPPSMHNMPPPQHSSSQTQLQQPPPQSQPQQQPPQAQAPLPTPPPPMVITNNVSQHSLPPSNIIAGVPKDESHHSQTAELISFD